MKFPHRFGLLLAIAGYNSIILSNVRGEPFWPGLALAIIGGALFLLEWR